LNIIGHLRWRVNAVADKGVRGQHVVYSLDDLFVCLMLKYFIVLTKSATTAGNSINHLLGVIRESQG
jgi:hypothetical protein